MDVRECARVDGRSKQEVRKWVEETRDCLGRSESQACEMRDHSHFT